MLSREALTPMTRRLLTGIFVAALALTPLTAETVNGKVHFRGHDGANHSLAELHGKPAVVNFWATWCGPCKEEMPRLQALADRYASKGVSFVAVSIDDRDTVGKVDSVVQQRGLRMPVWTGASDRTLEQLKLGEMVPATLILDENGAVIGKIEGEAHPGDVESRLDWLLAGRSGPAPKPVVVNK